MRKIDVSDEVYESLVKHVVGFGDTPDAVLRRLLKLPPENTDQRKSASINIAMFCCTDLRDEHETQGTAACVHCGFEDAVCVGKRRDWDGDWYDCEEAAEWMGILERGRRPEPFCGTCIDNVETRLYPSKNGNVSTPGEAFPTSLLAGMFILVSDIHVRKS